MKGLGEIGSRVRTSNRILRLAVVLVVIGGISAPALLAPQNSLAAAVAADSVVLLHPDGASGDSFGFAVDTDGSRVVVGAPYHDEVSPYVFLNIGSMSMFAGPSWEHETTLYCTNSEPLGEMYARWFCGYSVAVEGDTTLMGAPQTPTNDVVGDLDVYGAVIETDWSGPNPAHVFTYGYQTTSFYGASVDMEQGERLLGAPWTRYWVGDDPIEMVGEGRILGSEWLEAPDPETGLELGWSVAIDGDLAVVGGNGAAYVYRDDGGWAFVQEIARPTDEWVSVALDDDLLVVGSRLEPTAAGDTGLAVVATWNGSQFIEQETLWPSDGADGDWFGRSVAIDAGRIVVGSPSHGAGAAYVYETSGGGWDLATKLVPPSGQIDDWFGWSVALDDSTIVVGAPKDDNGGGVDAGAAYVFDLEATAPPTTTTTPPPGDSDGTFTDDDGSIFEADIEWLAASGITKGCNPPDNTKYCPDRAVTRGQMAAFLVRAMGYGDDGGGGLFVDTVGSVFAADIDKLAVAGVTKGCNPPDNTKYCPDRAVTRGQMAAFLVRAMGYGDDGGGGLFVDTVGSVFAADIDKLAVAGVTKGCNPPENTKYCPDRPVTRAQMAAFLHRALDS